MAKVLNLIRLLKKQSPIGEECTLCDNVFELGDAAQIFGAGDSLKAYCLDCQKEKAEKKGLEIRIHEGKASSSTTEKKSRKEGKKTRKKTEKKSRVKKAEEKLEVIQTVEEEADVLSSQEIVDLVQAGMDKIKVHYDAVLETFAFLQNPANGEFPEFPIGTDTLIRKQAEAIWKDGWLFKQLDTKNGRVEAHSLPEEKLDKCPATTGKGEPCQNSPVAEKVYCGSHKAQEQSADVKPTEKKERKTRKKKVDLGAQLGI